MKYLQDLQAVAQGFRAPVRHVQIRPDRSVGLYKSLRGDPKKHDSLRERIKSCRKALRLNVLDATARANLKYYQTELALRLSGKPTEDFQAPPWPAS